jgi:apolipoprotein N-acyltransferase
MKKNPWLPGLLSGILLALTTIARGPFPFLQWAIFFGFVPLWNYWLGESSLKRIAVSGWVCQLVFTLISFHWLAYTVNEFSHMGMALSILVMLFYCAIGNLQFTISGVLWAKIFKGKAAASIAGLVFLSALAERLCTTIFHWNFGYAWLFLHLPAAQLADIAGVRWLCSLTFCMNGFLAAAWFNRRNRGWIRPLASGIAVFAGLNAVGAWHIRQLPPPDASTKVLLIQPNIGNREKEKLDHDKTFREVELEKYFSLTKQALASLPSSPDFTIWPENAFPGYIADKDLTFGLTPKLRDFIRAQHINLVTGAYGFSLEGKTTNGLFSLEAPGSWRGPAYEKRLLLPFGEYIPGAETFPTLKKWLPDVRDYGRGDGPILLQVAGLRVGAQICYEGLFDFISRDIANAGAQIIVNVTNDSWYGSWMEPWQDFYITLAKAVETRRPLIRDTNTGISSVALANGTILEMSPVDVEWFHLFEVPYRREPIQTIFMGWGYRIDWIFLGFGIAISFFLNRLLRLRGAIPASEE